MQINLNPGLGKEKDEVLESNKPELIRLTHISDDPDKLCNQKIEYFPYHVQRFTLKGKKFYYIICPKCVKMIHVDKPIVVKVKRDPNDENCQSPY